MFTKIPIFRKLCCLYVGTGQHIKTLVDGRKSSGTHQLRFRGGNLARGIYFYRMFINGRLQETKKMLLLK